MQRHDTNRSYYLKLWHQFVLKITVANTIAKLNSKPLFEAILELMIFFRFFLHFFLLTKFKAHFSVIETFWKVGYISCSKFKPFHTNFFVNFYFLHNKNHFKPFFHILEIGQSPTFFSIANLQDIVDRLSKWLVPTFWKALYSV